MSKGGLAKQRLERMHNTMKGFVEREDAPGIVTLIHRKGETFVDVIGNKALDNNDSMKRDTIFRITSMTKPITAVATMILVEECKLRLDEPVDRLLPELVNRKVLKRIDGQLDQTVPANRPITVRDLLTFRMGFGGIWGAANVYPIQRAVSELKIASIGPPEIILHKPDEWMRLLGTLPLMYQPGERWAYNSGSYVLGVLIARASGQPLERFFNERIFEPLGMKDTSFFVPDTKLDRLATSYIPQQKTGKLELLDSADKKSRWYSPPIFPDAGAGLVSTIDDYLAFAQMMSNQRKLGKTRILSRPSVELIVTDHLTPEQKALSSWLPGHFDTIGWGFGLSVITNRGYLPLCPGSFGWDGGYGTSWYSDPKEDMIAILMTQQAGFPLFNKLYLDFWTSVYQAIDD